MKVVCLDRDGVINYDSLDYIKSPDEWHPIPNALKAIAELNKAGYLVIVISNQSGIARALYSEADLSAIHEKMHIHLAQFGGHIDAIYYCPHHPDELCQCRKPQAGLFKQAGADFHFQWQGVPYIGDKLSDVMVARALGAVPYLVKTGIEPAWKQLQKGDQDVIVTADLTAAVEDILKRERD